jgi:hypothetical protein
MKDREAQMFACGVHMHLKPNSIGEFKARLEREVIPALRKQAGFQNELTFFAPSGREVFAISLWDRTESAEAYNRTTYPEVTRILAAMVEGTPQVETETFDVANSTSHEMAATVTA